MHRRTDPRGAIIPAASRCDAQIGTMLFVFCVALLNLALGYAVGLYWGPIPWSLDRRRTYASPEPTVDDSADGADIPPAV